MFLSNSVDMMKNLSRSKERSTRKRTPIKVNANPNLRKYFCDVCDVYASCQKTYDLHLNGRKHKEKQINRKRPAPKRELKEDDVTRQLVYAINGFLDRQAKKEPVDEEKVNTSDEFELKFPELSQAEKLPPFLFWH